MDLDNLQRFQQIDSQNVLGAIDSLPEKLLQAWEAGQSMPLSDSVDVQQIVIAASGDSASAADLVSAAVFPDIRLPLTVHRGFGLPASAYGKQTLVICLGAAEETVDAFHAALSNGCSLFVVSGDGAMQKLAQENHIPCWTYAPRSAIEFSFALLLALLTRCGFIPDPSDQVSEAVRSMQVSQEHLRAQVPAANNAAKRYAGQLVGRWVSFVGAGRLAPIALYWKTRVNRMAKAAATAESVPDAGYHAAFAVMNPAPLLNSSTMTLFLRAPADDPRDRMRSDMMRQHFLLEGMNTDFVDARGESALANIWTLILFGEYMAYYLAMAYGVDPS